MGKVTIFKVSDYNSIFEQGVPTEEIKNKKRKEYWFKTKS